MFQHTTRAIFRDLCYCYHNAFERSVVQQVNGFTVTYSHTFYKFQLKHIQYLNISFKTLEKRYFNPYRSHPYMASRISLDNYWQLMKIIKATIHTLKVPYGVPFFPSVLKLAFKYFFVIQMEFVECVRVCNYELIHLLYNRSFKSIVITTTKTL